MNGLINIGNTCYLNSALQFILNVDEIVNFIIKNKNATPIMNILYNFTSKYINSNNSTLNPSELKSYIGSKKDIFNNFNQQDSSEFIIYLFDIVNDELKKNSLNLNINKKLNLHLTTSIKCKRMKCLNESTVISKELFLFLSYEENLTDSYRLYKENEKLDEENKYMCESCNKKTIARKKIVVNKWPNNLFILMNRYTKNLKKKGNEMEIPINWRHNYKLKGGIVHSGSLSGGHYVYFGKKNNNWYLFNDSNVSLLSNENLNNLKNNAYILHYKMSDNIDE